LLAQPGITVRTGKAVADLAPTATGWEACAADGAILAAADVVVIANGPAVADFAPTRSLPLERVRGQTTRVAATPASDALGAVLCAERTVFPARKGAHTLAASYTRHDASVSASDEDDRDNLALAAKAFAAADVLGGTVLDNWVAVRANTPDRNPLIGQVPDLPAMTAQYAGLSRDASTQFAETGTYLPGLYINAAHGSNGLATAPLAGEIVAGLISGEPLPVDRAVLDQLNPVRFLIRDLKRQKTTGD